jgi:chromosome segregation ATPase
MKRLAVALIVAVGLSAQFGAQAEDAKASKEREALRRAQAALRAAQEQQSTLQAEKAKAEAGTAAAQKEAAAAKAQAAGTAARLRSREAELETLRAQLQAAQAAQQQGEARAAEREQVLQQQLLAARQDGAARQQANLALVRLLERSTEALADAEAKNHKLYAIGQDLVQRSLGRSPLDTALQQDPVLGLAAVRLEDQAEKLRAELAAQRVTAR